MSAKRESARSRSSHRLVTPMRCHASFLADVIEIAAMPIALRASTVKSYPRPDRALLPTCREGASSDRAYRRSRLCAPAYERGFRARRACRVHGEGITPRPSLEGPRSRRRPSSRRQGTTRAPARRAPPERFATAVRCDFTQLEPIGPRSRDPRPYSSYALRKPSVGLIELSLRRPRRVRAVDGSVGRASRASQPDRRADRPARSLRIDGASSPTQRGPSSKLEDPRVGYLQFKLIPCSALETSRPALSPITLASARRARLRCASSDSPPADTGPGDCRAASAGVAIRARSLTIRFSCSPPIRRDSKRRTPRRCLSRMGLESAAGTTS